MNAPSDPRPAGRVPRGVVLLATVGLLWGGWQGVKALIRAWVDTEIEGTVGRAVEFELPDLDGRVWRSAELRGRRLVLNFFRSQCVGCVAERDAVKALAAEVDPERVVVLGVLLDRVQGYTEEQSARTLEVMGYEHPVLIADTSFVDSFHGAGWAHVTPVTYVLGSDGTVETSLRGHQTLEALRRAAAGTTGRD